MAKGFTALGTTGNDLLDDLGHFSNGWTIDFFADDTIFGLAGNDVISINYGNDIVYGGEGNDTIGDLGGGHDQIYGEAGQDTIFAGSGINLYDGGTGIDTVNYSLRSSNNIVDLQQGRSLSTGQNGFGFDTLVSIENVIGSSFVDSITGNADSNALYGRDGNDGILGLNGSDWLSGGNGSDYLDGGADADWLYGGAGDDRMVGGDGADMFIFGDMGDFSGLDVIADFVHGVDKIDLSLIDARPDVPGDQPFYFDPDADSDDFFDGLDGSGGGVIYNGTMGIDGDTREVTYRWHDGNTYVFVSTDDSWVVAQIQLNGQVDLTASDFIL